MAETEKENLKKQQTVPTFSELCGIRDCKASVFEFYCPVRGQASLCRELMWLLSYIKFLTNF